MPPFTFRTALPGLGVAAAQRHQDRDSSRNVHGCCQALEIFQQWTAEGITASRSSPESKEEVI